ncbi:hypothetical protein ACMFMF_009563 [Clarireedia jacksonii]
MKLITALLILSCALLSAVQAADFTTLLAALPTCAVNCFVPAVQASGCSPTDVACICSNTELSAAASICMAGTCTVVEQLKVARLTEIGCGVTVDTSDQTQIRIISWVFCIVSLVFVVIRLWVKMKLADQLGIDDWLMCLAAVLVIPYLYVLIAVADIGFGLNMWEIDTDKLNEVFHLFWVDECIYLALLAVTKLSLLVFILRIFPARSFRIACYCVCAFTIAIGLTFIMTTIFSCDPIPYFWTKWDGVVLGKCNDVNLQTYIAAGFNIVQDFTILLLPLPELWKLQVSVKKKVQLFFMFSVGLFVSIISIIRLKYLVTFNNTTNPTKDYTPIVVWSVVETQAGIICACLPSIRHLMKHVLPAGFLSSQKSSRQKGTNTTSGNGTGHSHKIWQSRSRKVEEFHELDDKSTTDLKSTMLTTVTAAPDGVTERDSDDGGESGRSRNARGDFV